MRFTDKTVLITGGASGIGFAAAQAFVAEGARVVITGRSATALETARAELGERALAVLSDAADTSDSRRLAERLRSEGLTLDAVFINAGIARFSPIADVTETLWDETFNINVRGAYFQIQALLPLLNRGASIVLNGSVNAHIGAPGSSIYAASKAALISLARTLSGELLPRNIRVNVVSAGPIDTPLYGKLGLDAATLDATRVAIQKQVPIGRFGRPEELATTVLHLAAPESSFIVGAEIVVDGGMSEI